MIIIFYGERFTKRSSAMNHPVGLLAGINRCSGLPNGVLHRLVLSAAAGAMPTCVPILYACVYTYIIYAVYKICTYLYIYIYYVILYVLDRVLYSHGGTFMTSKKCISHDDGVYMYLLQNRPMNYCVASTWLAYTPAVCDHLPVHTYTEQLYYYYCVRIMTDVL